MYGCWFNQSRKGSNLANARAKHNGTLKHTYTHLFEPAGAVIHIFVWCGERCWNHTESSTTFFWQITTERPFPAHVLKDPLNSEMCFFGVYFFWNVRSWLFDLYPCKAVTKEVFSQSSTKRLMSVHFLKSWDVKVQRASWIWFLTTQKPIVGKETQNLQHRVNSSIQSLAQPLTLCKPGPVTS